MLHAIVNKIKISTVRNGQYDRVQGQINDSDLDLLENMVRWLVEHDVSARLYPQSRDRLSCRLMVVGSALGRLARLALEADAAGERTTEFAWLAEKFPPKNPDAKKTRRRRQF